MDSNSLLTCSKEELVKIIVDLNEKITKIQNDYHKITNLRLYNLERNAYMNAQYLRRDTFEITGIPADIDNENIEDQVIEILNKDLKVNVNRQPIKKIDIHASHRFGKKDKVIVKVVNRKFAEQAIRNGKKLKNSKRYGESTKLFINESLIPEFNFLGYVIRNAARNKLISRYKIRNGVYSVQIKENEDFIEIGHQNDLENAGIAVPEKNQES